MLRLGLAGIVKNESDALLEWIAFHRVLGIQHFFIADNESTDGTRQLLEALQQSGAIDEVIDVPTLPGCKPQLPAYDALLSKAKDRCDLIAFLDADEFLVPNDGASTLHPLMERIFADADVSALALNWMNFGSGGQIFFEGGLVIERFTKHAKAEFGVHHHIKTILRPHQGLSFNNPHYVNLISGKYVNTKGEVLENHHRHGKGLSSTICWEGAQVNHYAVKSLEEFLVGKSRRGSASKEGRVKHKQYFQGHDRNEETNLMAKRYVEATRAEIGRLTDLINQHVKAAPETNNGLFSWLQRKFSTPTIDKS